MIENELIRRTRKMQEGLLAEGCTQVPESQHKDWVKLNKPVALICLFSGTNGTREGQIVHATEVRLENDEVKLQENTSIMGLSFNFDFASDPEARGKTLPLLPGRKVMTLHSHSLDGEWSEEIQATRRWRVKGKITGSRRADSHAWYYDVAHDGGSSSSYYPTEIVELSEKN